MTDTCHSLLCCMGWAETVLRLGSRWSPLLFPKWGASFINFWANSLLGLCCKDANWYGKNTISNQAEQKNIKLIFKLTVFGWIGLPIVFWVGLGILMELVVPPAGNGGGLTWVCWGRGWGILIRGPWGPFGWLVGPGWFCGPVSTSDWRPKA